MGIFSIPISHIIESPKMTLKEITRGILYESVSNDDINNAIDNHKYVVVTYEGTDGTHIGKRMIEPVAFGCTNAGNPVVRAFERFGDTKTFVPRWKFLRVDRILSWKETDKTFNEPEDMFNPNGDNSMSIVYNIAKFGDNASNDMRTPISSPKRKGDEHPDLFRTDTELKMDKLRKQLQNPLTLSDFKTQNAFDSTNGNGDKEYGPKKNVDIKNGTDSVYTNDYNYNVFDDSLNAAGKKTKRNGNYYFQNRKNGKFSRGSILDEPIKDDDREIDDYLNNNRGHLSSLEDLRKTIGDYGNPISIRDLKNRLNNR